MDTIFRDFKVFLLNTLFNVYFRPWSPLYVHFYWLLSYVSTMWPILRLITFLDQITISFLNLQFKQRVLTYTCIHSFKSRLKQKPTPLHFLPDSLKTWFWPTPRSWSTTESSQMSALGTIPTPANSDVLPAVSMFSNSIP